MPEFVIVAAKDSSYVGERNSIWEPVKAASGTAPEITRPISCLVGGRRTKWTLRISQQDDERRSLMVKVCPPPCDNSALSSEFCILTHLTSGLGKDPDPHFSVPRPVGSSEFAGWHLTAETVVEGMPLSQLMFLRSRAWRAAFLRGEFPRFAAIATEASDLLKGSIPVHTVARDWYQVPGDVGDAARIAPAVALEADKWRCRGIRAHGDFTIENIFLDESAKAISIIDWEQPLEGVPPLYDVLTLLFSSTAALALENQESAVGESVIGRQFLAAFFGSGEWAKATRDILVHAADHLCLSGSDIWREFLLFLVIRINHFQSRASAFAAQYSHLLELAIQHERFFCLREGR